MINSLEDKAKSIISFEAEAVGTIPVSHAYTHAIDMIHFNAHKRECPGKLIVSGMGKAGEIAKNISTTFSSTGTPAVFLHPADAQHGDLGIVQPHDVLLLVSNSGETREILELIQLVDNLWGPLPVISITGTENSTLGQSSDACLSTGHPDEVCPLGLSPTTSTTVMTVIGDVLISLMMDKIEFTNEQYAKRHHGGYLGDKTRSLIEG